jgi:hypothetical protein
VRFHTAEGHGREVTIKLDRPLGPRVLVDLDATPAEVREADREPLDLPAARSNQEPAGP